jgi:hypothetical protein
MHSLEDFVTLRVRALHETQAAQLFEHSRCWHCACSALRHLIALEAKLYDYEPLPTLCFATHTNSCEL